MLPHRRQLTRLPRPGILQARTLEWVAISFSNAWKWKVKVKLLSRVWLLATPWTAAYRLLHPWDFPGKSTGVGCHCLLRYIVEYTCIMMLIPSCLSCLSLGYNAPLFCCLLRKFSIWFLTHYLILQLFIPGIVFYKSNLLFSYLIFPYFSFFYNLKHGFIDPLCLYFILVKLLRLLFQ